MDLSESRSKVKMVAVARPLIENIVLSKIVLLQRLPQGATSSQNTY